MPKYNHAYDLGFSVISNHPQGDDVTPEMFRAALIRRMTDLDQNNEWGEVLGRPFDTHEEEPEAEAEAEDTRQYPIEDWQYEVSNGDTQLGYVAWVLNKIEAEDD